MRIPRLFYPKLQQTNSETFTLTSLDNHRLTHVLRLQSGNTVIVFDGQGYSATAQIQTLSKKTTTLQLNDSIEYQPASGLSLHLGIGISKGEKMDFALQKSVELGASCLTPLWCERSEVRLDTNRLKKKQAHWQQVIISSCEQCHQNHIPLLKPATRLSQWVKTVTSPIKYILHPQGEHSLNTTPTFPKTAVFATGPEGGFTGKEIEQAQAQNFKTLNLGPRILRAETAPIVILSLAQWLWGDFKS